MHVTAPTRGLSAELARYVRSEYGAEAVFAAAALARARTVQSTRVPNGSAGLLRRFAATLAEALAAARASPGGA